jgi:CRP-like cAMP-binding protein
MNLPLFQNLPVSDIRDMSDHSTTRNYRPGEVIIGDGETGEDLFVILGGMVEVRKHGRSVSSLGAGDIVGEMAMISRKPRSASVVMTDGGDVIRIPSDAYAISIEHHPETWRALCALAIERLQRMPNH